MKKFLLSLFVCVVGFVSFGYCQGLPLISYGVNNLCESSSSDPVYRFAGVGYFCYDLSSDGNWINNYPSLRFYSDYTNTYSFYLDVNSSSSNSINSSISSCIYVSQQNAGLLIQGYNGRCWDFEFKQSNSSSCDDPYTSLECQTEYNLIPVNDVDINYCVGNQLCPNESGTGDFSGDLQFSNIYINDILHPGKQNIFVNIPDYIMWDYNVVGDDFNIYVGSGYDVDYINSVIDINSYRPTSSDFTNVFVGGLTLIFPYIVIVLFIVFIRKLIKRIFK